MERIDFLATDGVVLNGLLYKSPEETKKIILAVHGMTSNCFKDRDTIIAKWANKNEIDYFCFNNRGSDLAKYIRKNIQGKEEKLLAGTSYEDVLEGYEDIVGAIIKLKELGYEDIYVQGHSLGCTKIVYTYNELKDEEDEIINDIKGVILLSLVDIPKSLKIYLRDKFSTYLQLAEEKEEAGLGNELMPKDAFIHPISVKTFLRYARDNKEIDFAKYSEDTEFEKLNNIEDPLFMRWGNNHEMIEQNADELVNMLSNAIKNERKDINYIDGADHSYHGKFEQLAEEIKQFLGEIKNG